MSWLSFPSLDALFTQLALEEARFVEPTCSGTLLPTGESCVVMARCDAFPALAAVKRLSHMSIANQALIKHFRNWLHIAGYGPAGRFVHGYAARLTLSLADADWRAVDSDTTTLALVEISNNDVGERVRDALRRGVDLFGRYLAIRRARALLPRHANGGLPWPETVITSADFDEIWGDEPEHDSAASGCVRVKHADTRRGYTKSNSLPKAVRAELKPGGLRLLSLHEICPANTAFYDTFRNWLSESGYGPSALYLYGLAARVALSVLDPKDWRDIDPDADLARVSAWIHAHYTSPGTLSTYAKGLAKFGEYLHRRQGNRNLRPFEQPPKPERAPKPERPPPCAPKIARVATPKPAGKPAPEPLPDAIQASLAEYFAHCRRNWPQDRVAEIATDWWSRFRRPLRLMRDSGISIETAQDLTPANWLRYVDMRLAAGISPVTLNGEFAALRGWLRWLDGMDLPVDIRMFKLRLLKEPGRVPKDLATSELHALQRAIELESLDLDAGARRRGIMDLAWFLLMLHAGLRTGEVRRLTPDDIC
jgi:integrase